MVRRLSVLLTILVMCFSATAWGDILFYVCNSGTGTISAVSSDGSKTSIASGLNNPRGLTLDLSGNFFATNWASGPGTGTVTKVDATTHAVTPIATGLWSPYGITTSTAGNVYFSTVADNGSTNIMTYSGQTVSSFVTQIGNGANGITFDATGNLFACNWADGTVVKITPNGVVSTYVSGVGAPNGVAIDSTGNLYVDDYFTGRLYKVATDGSKSIFATGFSAPTGLAFDDANQCLYLANSGSTTISKITLNGAVTTFASGFSAPVAIVMNTIPEPASLALVGTGALLLLARRRRQA